MLEKMKEVPFIDESIAVKVMSVDGKIVLERNDRVVWAREVTNIESEGVQCYVPADRFFSLFQEIKSLRQTTCLEVTLKNGAKYELPFMDVSWDSQDMPQQYDDSITFKISDLMMCTLRNLIKPELQCIYIDQEGAVSCNLISACVTKAVRSTSGLLLPPDVQELVDGRLCSVKVDGGRIYIKSSDFDIVTQNPTSEDEWWNTIRAMVPQGDLELVDATTLQSSLKRLVMFGDYALFDGDKVTSGSNFEPFHFKDMEERQYEIERLLRLLSVSNKLGSADGNLILSSSSSLFLLSPMEEA